jgi:hypothetical protein
MAARREATLLRRRGGRRPFYVGEEGDDHATAVRRAAKREMRGGRPTTRWESGDAASWESSDGESCLV